MTFRERLLATLRAVEPILEVPGVLVAGSEVPNLLELDAAATLVVSQDVDLSAPTTPGHRRVAAPAGEPMTIAERVKAVRARARVRRWEYRQRNLAHGAWARFRAALAHAREAYAIDDEVAAALLAEGFTADDRGRGLEPPRTLIWISAERASRLAGARPLALRLDAELLAARCLALVPF